MPRRTRVPALVHHKPSGHARVRIAGRDFYLGRYGSAEAQEAYRRVIGEWLSTGRLPGTTEAPPSPAPRAVNELILEYWRYAKRYYAGNASELCLVRQMLRLLREHYGGSALAEFGPLKLKALREGLVRRGLTRYGVNRRVDVLKRAFKWGVEQEVVPPHVFHGLSAVGGLKKGRTEAPDPPPVEPVPSHDLERTVPHLPSVVRDMVLLQLLTGARPGELCRLRPRDVDRSGDVWEYAPPKHKTEHHGVRRRIYFGPQAKGLLAAYLEGRGADAYCFSPAEAEAARRAAAHEARKTPLLCGNRPGTNKKQGPARPAGACYDVNSYRRAIHRACDKAGVPRWSPNRLRHARATELRRLFGIEAAQVVLGHTKLSTSEAYAERDLAKAKEIMRQVG